MNSVTVSQSWMQWLLLLLVSSFEEEYEKKKIFDFMNNNCVVLVLEKRCYFYCIEVQICVEGC